MYETVKTVKGHEIYRMVGTRKCFHVASGNHSYLTFQTIKAATEYIVNNF
jgi:hypothetical protein